LPLQIPLICVKDKQAFRKAEGTLRRIGNPAQLARELSGSGTRLLHVIDLDANRGQATNMDIYNSLTYFINVEVECSAKKDTMDRLFRLKARIVLELPCKLDLSEFKKNERLLVGSFGKEYDGDAAGVHDVIIKDADDAAVKRFAKLGKRIIVFESDYGKLETGNRKLVWGVIKPF